VTLIYALTAPRPRRYSAFVKKPDGTTKSSWYTGLKLPRYRTLSKSTPVDVCIVGAGIAGLSVAYLLAKEGKSVIVLDEGPIGSGQTGRTSAHLASAIDDRFVEIERQRGKEESKLAYESHAAAIDTIERIATENQIDCNFARLNAFLSPLPTDPPDLLDREFAAAQRAGFADIELLATGGLYGGRCIRFGNQARFQPMQYLIGLANAVTAIGGRICIGKRVIDVQGADVKKDIPAIAKLRGGLQVSAGAIVVATNTPSPINDWFGIYTKQAAYRSYVIGMTVPRDAIADALYWDTADPYHYVRLQRPKASRSDLLLIGGEDHKVGQPPVGEDPFKKLEVWTREHFPAAQRVKFRWSGQVQEPADGLAFIGRANSSGENLFVATGDSGMGLTHGTIAGLLITDLIMGRENPWEKLYDPSRKMLNVEFVTENLNTVTQYKDFLTAGDVGSVEHIPKGEGALIRDGLTKLAVYRDEEGHLHKHSAICTHLQCIVQWNAIEKTWDCPCHGSRFDRLGKVLIGPAIDDLPAAK
jgi:glycine/D-amino acid oxidase-like deaminating enzyme/nitrite reductase/ring-hydroxylating ferredoxin subunit